VLAALVGSACAASGSTAEPSATGAVAAYSFRSILSASNPVHVSAPANKPGWLYVVEQAGRIRLAVNGRYRATPFLDIRRLVRSGGEQGLLSVAFHPQFAKNRRFFVNYTDVNGHTRVVEYRSNAAGTQALSRTRKQWLFVAQPYSNHNGGQVAFGPDGRLYVGMGDGGSGGDPENRAQNMGTLLGKLVRLNVAVARPNPQIAALGLRNPWRFSFDRASGDLYIADVGQNAWEEIDFVAGGSAAGMNFGWNRLEGSHEFAGDPPPNAVPPIFEYPLDGGACAAIGGYVYRGSRIPALTGAYLYSDFCESTIRAIVQEGGRITDQRDLGEGNQVTSFGEDQNGELYVLSQGDGLQRIDPA
jgi:glucose/arabinose dehydrogenase